MARIEAYTDEADIAEARAGDAGRLVHAAVDHASGCWTTSGMPAGAGAREGVARLRQAGVTVAIASITWAFAVEWFAEQLGAAYVLGTGPDPKGQIKHVWPGHKADWLARPGARQLGCPIRRRTAAWLGTQAVIWRC